jgi:hypothetical protein
MPQNLKIFEGLFYAAIALDLVSSLIPRATALEIIAIVILEAIIAALVWAAARRAKVWAAWVLVFVTAIGVLALMANFSVGMPAWLSFLRPETPPTTLEKVLDVISVILSVAALYFYFFARPPAVARP